jgi:hypothetical protein
MFKKMAQKVEKSGNYFRSLYEFLQPYDSYEGRMYSDWELAIIFEGFLTIDDAKYLIENISNRRQPQISYSELVQGISKFIQMQPGVPNKYSVYDNKHKS